MPRDRKLKENNIEGQDMPHRPMNTKIKNSPEKHPRLTGG
jgi:hypothetical protein